jgi:hypothetical protein
LSRYLIARAIGWTFSCAAGGVPVKRWLCIVSGECFGVSKKIDAI